MYDSAWANNVSYAPLLSTNVLHLDLTQVPRGSAGNGLGYAMPYEEPNPIATYQWRDSDKIGYQIITAGLDEYFGGGTNDPRTLNTPPIAPSPARAKAFLREITTTRPALPTARWTRRSTNEPEAKCSTPTPCAVARVPRAAGRSVPSGRIVHAGMG